MNHIIEGFDNDKVINSIFSVLPAYLNSRSKATQNLGRKQKGKFLRCIKVEMLTTKRLEECLKAKRKWLTLNQLEAFKHLELLSSQLRQIKPSRHAREIYFIIQIIDCTIFKKIFLFIISSIRNKFPKRINQSLAFSE